LGLENEDDQIALSDVDLQKNSLEEESSSYSQSRLSYQNDGKDFEMIKGTIKDEVTQYKQTEN
jgi:hypothetical protein